MSPERDGSRRITSIPPRTLLDVSRGGVTLRIGGGNLLGGVGRIPRESTARKTDWSQTVSKHVFQKPPVREKVRREPLYKRDEKIGWVVDIIEGYNVSGDLGIILEFTGIGLTKVSFLRSRHNKLDSPVFYIPVSYNGRMARLFLATRGDIFESQIVPTQMDVNPFFQEELFLPQLTTTHDPISMIVSQNNKLVIVGYNPRT